MLETIEFRIPESYAEQFLPSAAGTRLGSVRKLKIRQDDPLFAAVGKADGELRSKGRAFFTAWAPHRKYSASELARAALLKLSPKRVFEPAGEECGTDYDESSACPECGAGALQISDLRLDLRKVPHQVDFAATIAGERIVSQRFAECMIDAGLDGFTLRRVMHKARYEDGLLDLHTVPTGREILRKADAVGVPHPKWTFWVWLNRLENRESLSKAVEEHAALSPQKNRGQVFPVWYQLVIISSPVEINPVTRAGADPFDEKADGRCSRGHVVGLNLLSEVTVSAPSWPIADVLVTRQMVGTRRGLLRPQPVLLVSPKAWQAMERAGLKGLAVEVAHVSAA
jgi:hypothetical protein